MLEYGKLILNPRSLEDIPSDFNFEDVGTDTETFGLHIEDKAFSFQISNEQYSIYWNLQHYPDAPFIEVLKEEECRELVDQILKKSKHVYIANAKYDMHRFRLAGLNPLEYNIYCNHTMHRLIKSNAESVSLASQGEYHGFPKDSAVEDYIKKNQLYEQKTLFGYDVEKKPLYSKVPWYLIQPYACRDAYLSCVIGKKQREYLKNSWILDNEIKLTKTLFKMEVKGVDVNKPYIEEKIKEHSHNMESVKLSLGLDFKDHPKYLENKFKEMGLPITLHWKKKTPTFTASVLEKHVGNPYIDKIIVYRYHKNLLKNFYLKIHHSLDSNNKCHADLVQYAAKTGRMSAKNPTLSNLPSRTGKDVKKAFLPPKDFGFYMPDYQAAELRITYDVANERKMIDRVLRGEDMHGTLAQDAGVNRDNAKTVQFANIYGSGIRGISQQLKRSEKETTLIVRKIRKNIPNVEKLKAKLQQVAKVHGAIRNPFGRIVRIDKGKEYKALNYYIQSTLADVIKFALVKIDEMLTQGNYKSYLILSVHDSILIALHKEELHLQTKINDIMKECYVPVNGLNLEITAEHSLVSYGDAQKGIYERTS